MAYHIKDVETDRIVRELAKLKRMPIIDSIREACVHEIERERAKTPLWERIRPLRERVADAPKTGLAANKPFFDDLSESSE